MFMPTKTYLSAHLPHYLTRSCFSHTFLFSYPLERVPALNTISDHLYSPIATSKLNKIFLVSSTEALIIIFKFVHNGVRITRVSDLRRRMGPVERHHREPLFG